MNATAVPLMNMVTDLTSVTYSYSSSFQYCTESSPLPDSHSLSFPIPEESLFMRQGDYWIIRYQGRVAFLKATRGLQCLSLLLHHPGREFHVRELLGLVVGKPAISGRKSRVPGLFQPQSDTGTILDAKAKAEYKLRLDCVRRDLEEAEQFNDSARAERARNEINAIAEQLASAVGLGGHDRRTGSEAERARSAVTKRIKDSINKIGQAIPLLRRYLATQIRTGYFCSYNLSQEHPMVWKFLILLTALCCDTESYTVT